MSIGDSTGGIDDYRYKRFTTNLLFRDLWRAGFPMALAGRIATFFSPLSPNQRGTAAVLTLLFGMLVMLGILGGWMLA